MIQYNDTSTETIRLVMTLTQLLSYERDAFADCRTYKGRSAERLFSEGR